MWVGVRVTSFRTDYFLILCVIFMRSKTHSLTRVSSGGTEMQWLLRSRAPLLEEFSVLCVCLGRSWSSAQRLLDWTDKLAPGESWGCFSE